MTAAKVAVLGAGTMGSGIAQCVASAGHEVALFDLKASQIDVALAGIRSSLDRFVAKDRMTAAAAEEALGAIHPADSVAQAASGADIVVEAVFERIEVKHQVFTEALASADDEAMMCTNTSQLSVTRVAAPFGSAGERFVGTHFFNPPVLMRLVEIVKGLQTTAETVERAKGFAAALGKETVVCLTDSPGFMTSRISAIVRLECLRMLEEGVGSAADIDKALRLGLNFPMGPLELGDFNGLDTYLDALESLSQIYGERFRPTVNLRNLVAAGRLGRKSGWGIYRYAEDGARLD